MTKSTRPAGPLPVDPYPPSLADATVHTSNPCTPLASQPVVELASKVAVLDPTLLSEFAATAVVVDAHAAALTVTLHRFNMLETRLCGVMRRLEQNGCRTSEKQFAALLDYIGSSDVRLRVDGLQEVFPP
jgi:hypothetical protein